MVIFHVSLPFSIQKSKMDVALDGQHKKSLFMPKPSPLGRSPGFSPRPPPVKKSPARPKMEDQPEMEKCCCFRRSPIVLKHLPIANQRNQAKQRSRGDTRVTFVTKVQEYISPRPSSSSFVHSPNLIAMTSQAKVNGWHIEPQEIELHEKIGRGSTADIYRGSWKGLTVAVKCITPEFFNFNESGVSYFIQEIETLSRQRHPFVLRLVGACLNPPHFGWVITEFLNMTLKEWLHGNEKRREKRSIPLPPTEDRIAKALEIAQAMQYLHDQKPKLVHRDLKPSNIFMDGAKHIRVADFGHARFLYDGEKALTGETGTYIYMAPEVIRSEPYNEKCDVFSYGVILNELITGEHPYIETDYGPTEIALGVSQGKLRPALPENDGKFGELIDLICHSWDEDTSKRPSFAIISCTLKRIQEKLTTVYSA